MLRALFLACVLAAATANVVAAGAACQPGASASSWAVRVVVAGGSDVSATRSGRFVWPADGSVIATGNTTASEVTTSAHGEATAAIAQISIFNGEITADAVSAKASAQSSAATAGGSFRGSGVRNLRVFGRPVTANALALGGWGELTVDARGVDTSAPQGAAGYRGFVTALDLHLNMGHAGLPAGSEIQIGYAEAAAQTAPATVKPDALPLAPGNPLRKEAGAPISVPLKVTPPIAGGPYDFPVYGQSSFVDTFGAYRADVNYHHGDDIFGRLGQPLHAVANGTLFSVGWNRVGGNRIWLRDAQGNEFYYAHLSAFSTLAVNGARVNAGDVIGFMGDTGDAEGTPTHLHFEVHPVSLLFLGYDGAVDPTSYLRSWKRLTSVPFPLVAGWEPTTPGTAVAPGPGALLLGQSDVSTADGLVPGSLRRAFG